MRIVILALLLAALATPLFAGTVDHSSSDVIATHDHAYSGAHLLLADGTVWYAYPNGYNRDEEYDPPVAVQEIKYWEMWAFITVSGETWVVDDEGPPAWINLGRVPIGPVSTDKQNVGSMKSRYKPQQNADDQKQLEE